MKAYTDLEQSKKLEEFLPLKSADMGWNIFVDDSTRCLPIDDWDLSKNGEGGTKFVPCWSLAASLNYLREIDFFPSIEADEHGVTMSVCYYDEDEVKLLNPVHDINVEAETFIDACYELLLKLKEQNII